MHTPLDFPKPNIEKLMETAKSLSLEEEQEIRKQFNALNKRNRRKETLTKIKLWYKKHWLTILGWLITNMISMSALVVAILSYLKQ